METFTILIFSIYFITVVVSVIIAVRKKEYTNIPSDLTFLLLWVFVILNQFVPSKYDLMFTYVSIPVLTGVFLVTATYYYKRKIKVYYWIFGVLSIILVFLLVLAILGILPLR